MFSLRVTYDKKYDTFSKFSYHNVFFLSNLHVLGQILVDLDAGRDPDLPRDPDDPRVHLDLGHTDGGGGGGAVHPRERAHL